MLLLQESAPSTQHQVRQCQAHHSTQGRVARRLRGGQAFEDLRSHRAMARYLRVTRISRQVEGDLRSGGQAFEGDGWGSADGCGQLLAAVVRNLRAGGIKLPHADHQLQLK